METEVVSLAKTLADCEISRLHKELVKMLHAPTPGLILKEKSTDFGPIQSFAMDRR